MNTSAHSTSAHIAAVDAVEAALRARTGLVLEGPRRADLDRALDKAMGGTDPAQWTARLEAEPALFDRVIAGVTIGETYFFRDPAHFAFLREAFLPAFRRRTPFRNVRAWSAGCSSGEEPYSLAILFDGAGVGAEILATDISRAALDKAKAGIYGRWSLRGDGARLAGGALRPTERDRVETFEISDRLKKQIKFTQMNLAKETEIAQVAAGTMDVILCRNVLIYLEPAVIQRLARRFFDALGEGGVLITGPSDPLLADAAPFACDYTPHGVVYYKDSELKKGGAVDGQKPAPAAVPLPVIELIPEPEPESVSPAPRPATLPPADARADMAAAFSKGDHERVIALADALPDDMEAAVLAVRACANMGDGARTAARAARAARAHPASRDIPYLHAIVLMNLGRLEEADVVLKRLIYLDPDLAVVHFTLGNLRLRAGDLAGARRAFTAAHTAAAARPENDVLALSEGETAGRLAAAAARLARRGDA